MTPRISSDAPWGGPPYLTLPDLEVDHVSVVATATLMTDLTWPDLEVDHGSVVATARLMSGAHRVIDRRAAPPGAG